MVLVIDKKVELEQLKEIIPDIKFLGEIVKKE